MKKRLLIVVFLLVFAMIMPVHAASDDMVDGYAAEYLQAVEAGKSAFTATVPTGDFAALLQQVFERYPVLFYYYNGYSGTIGVEDIKSGRGTGTSAVAPADVLCDRGWLLHFQRNHRQTDR